MFFALSVVFCMCFQKVCLGSNGNPSIFMCLCVGSADMRHELAKSGRKCHEVSNNNIILIVESVEFIVSLSFV